MNDEVRMKKLLKQAVRPVDVRAEPARDLWPAVLRRIDQDTGTDASVQSGWLWLDGALLAGLVVLGVSFPTTIPLLLYYL